ncbi:hypothetical protein OHV05_26920 [Kitasatospora sp. NBC_00070]
MTLGSDVAGQVDTAITVIMVSDAVVIRFFSWAVVGIADHGKSMHR